MCQTNFYEKVCGKDSLSFNKYFKSMASKGFRKKKPWDKLGP